jgi:predicted esterase
MNMNKYLLIFLLLLIPLTGRSQSIFPGEVVYREITYYYWVAYPANYSEDNSYPLIVVMHEIGYKALDLLQAFLPLTDLGYIVLAPQGIYEEHGGNAWVRKELLELDIRHLDWGIPLSVEAAKQEFKAISEEIYLFGYGQGGDFAVYLAFKYPEQFPYTSTLAAMWLMLNQFNGESGPRLNFVLHHGLDDKDTELSIGEQLRWRVDFWGAKYKWDGFRGDHKLPLNICEVILDDIAYFKDPQSVESTTWQNIKSVNKKK